MWRHLVRLSFDGRRTTFSPKPTTMIADHAVQVKMKEEGNSRCYSTPDLRNERTFFVIRRHRDRRCLGVSDSSPACYS